MAADLSSDGRILLSGGPERVLKGIDSSTGKVLYQSDKHTDWILDVAIDPEGLMFVSADRAGNVFAWELEAGTLVHTLRGHRGPVHEIVWFPDGNECATVGEDGTVRVWEMHTGVQRTSWLADARGLLGVAVDAESRVTTIGRSGNIQTWDRTGRLVAERKQEDFLPLEVETVGMGGVVVGDWSGEISAWASELAMPRVIHVSVDQTTNDLARVNGIPRKLADMVVERSITDSLPNMSVPETKTDDLAEEIAAEPTVAADSANWDKLNVAIAKGLAQLEHNKQMIAKAHEVVTAAGERWSQLTAELHQVEHAIEASRLPLPSATNMVDQTLQARDQVALFASMVADLELHASALQANTTDDLQQSQQEVLVLVSVTLEKTRAALELAREHQVYATGVVETTSSSPPLIARLRAVETAFRENRDVWNSVAADLGVVASQDAEVQRLINLQMEVCNARLADVDSHLRRIANLLTPSEVDAAHSE